MASQTEIANLALSHLGIGKEISNLETERSEEAGACRRYFDIALDMVLSDFSWPFATKIADLALVESTPNDEWAYSYRYPTDCLKARRVLSGNRNDNRQSRVPYKIANDTSGIILFCDFTDAQMEYTARVSDPVLFPSDFTIALSYLIASFIAPRITSGDRFGLTKEMMQFYKMSLLQAQASAVNEEQPDQEPDSEFIRVREGYDSQRFPSLETTI